MEQRAHGANRTGEEVTAGDLKTWEFLLLLDLIVDFHYE